MNDKNIMIDHFVFPLMLTSSTSNTKSVLGGMAPPAPLEP